MQRYNKLGTNGRVKVIESDWFKIEGQSFQIAEMEFDPYTLQQHSFGFENSQIFNLPPHLMMILGEALIEAAHSNFESLEKNFRKEADELLAKAENNKKVVQLGRKK
jgi:predicted nucleotide-binding protein (sugar kinase/HSP70/actin superfamily)